MITLVMNTTIIHYELVATQPAVRSSSAASARRTSRAASFLSSTFPAAVLLSVGTSRVAWTSVKRVLGRSLSSPTNTNGIILCLGSAEWP